MYRAGTGSRNLDAPVYRALELILVVVPGGHFRLVPHPHAAQLGRAQGVGRTCRMFLPGWLPSAHCGGVVDWSIYEGGRARETRGNGDDHTDQKDLHRLPAPSLPVTASPRKQQVPARR
jgi:hypothetical protein